MQLTLQNSWVNTAEHNMVEIEWMQTGGGGGGNWNNKNCEIMQCH